MNKIYAKEDAIEVDYADLSQNLRGLTKVQQEEAANAFMERINTLAVERENIAPNLKAIGKLLVCLGNADFNPREVRRCREASWCH
jgi:hypothetical protein